MSFPTGALPLTFNRVMEGRPIAATSSRLLNIPVELLTIIVGYVALDKSDLASLARVNSDCRQLARSCQFHTLVLDFSARAIQILPQLQKEAVQRLRSPQGLTLSPSLGACVRTLRSDLSEYWPQVGALKVDDEKDETKLDQWRAAARLIADYMNDLYMPTVLLVIPTLPHLESLALASCNLDDELLDCLTMCRLKDLKLEGSFMRTPNIRAGRKPWPLRTLDVNASWDFQFSYKPLGELDSSSFWQALLEMCCLTLRYLKLELRSMDHIPGLEHMKFPISFNVGFPNLTVLSIDDSTLLDATTLHTLLQSDLNFLKVNYEDPVSRQVLCEVDRIPTLKTLLLGGCNLPPAASTHFIEINTQLVSFAAEASQPDAFLRRLIYSLIDHDNLRTLSLKWTESEIPDESLDELALLPQVEVLHLSAGSSSGYPHDWFVDHDKLNSHLGQLANLRRLLITRDTYQLPADEIDFGEPDRYYDHRGPKHGEKWTTHVTQMLEHASAYVQTFPKLEFICVGQVLFTVQVVAGTRKPVVTGTAWIGEGGYAVLRKEFGIDTWSFR